MLPITRVVVGIRVKNGALEYHVTWGDGADEWTPLARGAKAVYFHEKFHLLYPSLDHDQVIF